PGHQASRRGDRPHGGGGQGDAHRLRPARRAGVRGDAGRSPGPGARLCAGHVAEPRKAPLCGNSIATDRAFLARDMPMLDAYLHYRMVDVSSIKELARRWYPRAYFASPPKHGGHRAPADVRESIQELRHHPETWF